MRYEPTRDIDPIVTVRDYCKTSVSVHYHQTLELVCCRDDGLRLHIGDGELQMHRGQTALIPSYVPHGMSSAEKAHYTTVMIPYPFFDQFLQSGIELPFGLFTQPEANARIFRMVEDLREFLDSPQLVLKGAVTVLLGYIAGHCRGMEVDNSKNALIIRIIEYINENYAEELTLAGVAEVFGYNKYYFSKLFNGAFHCSLPNYVNSVRKNKADALMQSGRSRSEAILECGFRSISSYYRIKE